MKVGILTFQNTTNYGALLQTYALQQSIASFGVESEVINYHCDAVEKRELGLLSFVNFKDCVRSLLLWIPKVKKARKFAGFMSQFVRRSPKEYTRATIGQADREYERFIVGSDQVWNPHLSGRDYTYFLDFCPDPSKKHTYAVSFGADGFDGETEKRMAGYLKDFSSLNIREESGLALARKLTGKQGTLALDPTFLIPRDQWVRLANRGETRPQEENYILIYLLKGKRASIQYAMELARKMNCTVKYINISGKMEPGVENIYTASPREFLSLLYRAKLVITGSYHGVALSINMNKPFLYELSSTQYNYNARINTIAKIFALEYRRVEGRQWEYPPIDFDAVNRRLGEYRAQSMALLKNACGVDG